MNSYLNRMKGFVTWLKCRIQIDRNRFLSDFKGSFRQSNHWESLWIFFYGLIELRNFLVSSFVPILICGWYLIWKIRQFRDEDDFSSSHLLLILMSFSLCFAFLWKQCSFLWLPWQICEGQQVLLVQVWRGS